MTQLTGKGRAGRKGAFQAPLLILLAWCGAAALPGCNRLPIRHEVVGDVLPKSPIVERSEQASSAPEAIAEAPVSASEPASAKVETEASRISFTPEGVDVGNGMKAPLGASEEQLLAAYPEITCFSLREGRECKINDPVAADCPGVRACRDLAFTLVGDRVVGFLADYNEDDWQALRAATAEKLGKAQEEANPSFGSVSSVQWSWSNGRLKLVFEHFGGTDIRGNSMIEPYAIIFGPIM